MSDLRDDAYRLVAALVHLQRKQEEQFKARGQVDKAIKLMRRLHRSQTSDLMYKVEDLLNYADPDYTETAAEMVGQLIDELEEN